MSAIRATGLSVSFGNKRVLSDLNMDVSPGEFLAIIGPSGAGKTTLLRIFNALLRPGSGEVSVLGQWLEFNNHDLDVRRRMALITQKPVPFNDTVFNNVAYPLKLRGCDDWEEMVHQALENANMTDKADMPARDLSGGELQRLAFARATVFKPELLLLDEFTAHLDPYNIGLLEKAVFDYLAFNRATAVMVTHNLFQARRISGQTALLLDGRIIEKGPTDRMFNGPEEERTAAFVRGDMVF